MVMSPLQAGDKYGHDHDFARSATQSGQAMHFGEIQQRVGKICNCQILEAKLHPEKDQGEAFLVYEIKAMRADGQIVKLDIHAISGEVLRLKGMGKRD